jgi:hypothetical protein
LKIKLDRNRGSRVALKGRSATKTIKQKLLEMPPVGKDKDFARRPDAGRRIRF